MGLLGKLFRVADHLVTLPVEVLKDVVNPLDGGANTAERGAKLIEELDGTADARRRRNRR